MPYQSTGLREMPRTEETNQRIREEQRRKILIAATKVFAHKGLAATKMADIAAEAGISYGLLYHYFTNKEVIFKAAIERATNSGFRVLIERVQHLPLPPWERIYQLTTIILDGILREPEGFLLSQQAITSEAVPQEVRELAIRSSHQGIEEFQKLIIEGQAAGQVVEGDPAELSALYFSCIGGIAMSYIQFFFPRSTYPKVESVLRLLRP
jgi:AcrR family transcriptional regulator